MRKVYVREEVCIGCGLCQIHCQVAHSQSRDIVKAFKRETPRPQPRIRVERKGEISFAVQCFNCADPWCVYACPTGAMYKDAANGMPLVAAERCIGCWTCVIACPYGALTRDMSNNLIAKCDLCPEEIVPACVANCPNEALVLSMDGEDGDV